eukprot:7867373-Heterocapsa_arctica.AAC.1
MTEVWCEGLSVKDIVVTDADCRPDPVAENRSRSDSRHYPGDTRREVDPFLLHEPSLEGPDSPSRLTRRRRRRLHPIWDADRRRRRSAYLDVGDERNEEVEQMKFDADIEMDE